MHLAYTWIVSHLSAKNYQNWCKFDEVLTKTNLLSFFGTRRICSALFGFVTKHMCDRQNYDSQDHASTAASCGKNISCTLYTSATGRVFVEYSHLTGNVWSDSSV